MRHLTSLFALIGIGVIVALLHLTSAGGIFGYALSGTMLGVIVCGILLLVLAVAAARLLRRVFPRR